MSLHSYDVDAFMRSFRADPSERTVIADEAKNYDFNYAPLSLGERDGVVAGIEEKLDGFTQDQRFFLNWARVWRSTEHEAFSELRLNIDAHSLDMVRANAAPSNLPSFAKAFGAKPGNAMARPEDQRVKIW